VEDIDKVKEMLDALLANRTPLLEAMLVYYTENRPVYDKAEPLYRRKRGYMGPLPEKRKPTNIYNLDNSRGIVKIANQGSSRSGKTWAVAQFLAIYCLTHYTKFPSSPGKYIGVWRNTLVDCRNNTFKDFKDCYEEMGLWDLCSVTTAPHPKIRLFGNTIEFRGLPETNQQPPRTDISFFNEVLEVNDKDRVSGIVMRCQYAAIFDWNPSLTVHWAFDMKQEMAEGKNVLYTETSYLDNPHLPMSVILNIEENCPWQLNNPAECEVITDTMGFKKRKWLKPERPDNALPREYHLYRADNEANATTKNRWRWLVYGEGCSSAREGAVFDPHWIDAFPQTGLDYVNLSLDFGYTCFSGDTLITTLDGEVPIRDVKVGDYVLTSAGYNRVLKHNKNGIKKVIEKNIYFDFGYKKIISTFDHKFKTDKGWKQFKDLQKGDKLNLLVPSTALNTTTTLTENTRDTSLEASTRKRVQDIASPLLCGISEIENQAEYETEVYDLTVENVHEYFANGVLVHNCDPSALVRSGRNSGSKDLFSELLLYHATPDPDTLFEAIAPHVWNEVERQLRETNPDKWVDSWKQLIDEGKPLAAMEMMKQSPHKPQIVIACESKDKYKDFEFVRMLNSLSLQRGFGWQFVKVKKPSIAARISLMKRFTMKIVKCREVEAEAQNYVYDVIEGRATNIPVDKFNHFWDALGYAVVYFYKWI
jgi:hypothetical protein